MATEKDWMSYLNDTSSEEQINESILDRILKPIADEYKNSDLNVKGALNKWKEILKNNLSKESENSEKAPRRWKVLKKSTTIVGNALLALYLTINGIQTVSAAYQFHDKENWASGLNFLSILPTIIVIGATTIKLAKKSWNASTNENDDEKSKGGK